MIQHRQIVARTTEPHPRVNQEEAPKEDEGKEPPWPMVAITGGPCWFTWPRWPRRPRLLGFSLQRFGSRAFCARFCNIMPVFSAIKRGHFRHLIHHYHPLDEILVLVSIRERESGKDCKDSMPGLRSKQSTAILAEHCFSFFSLFSL